MSVATGDFVEGMHRLRSKLPGEAMLSWENALPPGSPRHELVPYAFKVYALKAALERGYEKVLWLDSSIVPLGSLELIWGYIEEFGYWFSRNLPHGRLDLPEWSVGDWCSDDALVPLGISREAAFKIPLVIGGAFGLDLRWVASKRFLFEYLRLAHDGRAFVGPYSNAAREASKDARVFGHRHDQTVASVLACKLGMTALTTPPKFIVDGVPPTDQTILEVRRR